MPHERNALKVGFVTIFVVVLFIVILLWISQRVGGEMQSLTIRFKSSPDMPTLVPGSQVLVGGHKVGEVKSATEALNQIWQEVSTELYQQAGPQPGAPGPGGNGFDGAAQADGEDVIDADYEVVDEEKK